MSATMEIELATKTREDIVKISNILARGIRHVAEADRDRPVLILLNGSFCSGKSLIADTVRLDLLSSASKLEFLGEKDWSERWRACVNGHDFEVSFNNVRDEGAIDNFADKSGKCGVAFFQNTPPVEKAFANNKHKPSMHIWLENRLHYLRCAAMPPVKKDIGIEKIFNRVKDKSWGRYLKLSVMDERLCASEAFNQAMQDIAKCGHELPLARLLKALTPKARKLSF